MSLFFQDRDFYFTNYLTFIVLSSLRFQTEGKEFDLNFLIHLNSRSGGPYHVIVSPATVSCA